MTDFSLIWYEIWGLHCVTLSTLWFLAPHFKDFTRTIAYSLLICAGCIARLIYNRLLGKFPAAVGVQFAGIILSNILVASLALSKSFRPIHKNLINSAALALGLWGMNVVFFPRVTLRILGTE